MTTWTRVRCKGKAKTCSIHYAITLESCSPSSHSHSILLSPPLLFLCVRAPSFFLGSRLPSLPSQVILARTRKGLSSSTPTPTQSNLEQGHTKLVKSHSQVTGSLDPSTRSAEFLQFCLPHRKHDTSNCCDFSPSAANVKLSTLLPTGFHEPLASTRLPITSIKKIAAIRKQIWVLK